VQHAKTVRHLDHAVGYGAQQHAQRAVLVRASRRRRAARGTRTLAAPRVVVEDGQQNNCVHVHRVRRVSAKNQCLILRHGNNETV
jgi:hypothetical protein